MKNALTDFKITSTLTPNEQVDGLLVPKVTAYSS